MPDTLPGHVYLCQVDEKLSCGACCGLYNVTSLSKPRLTALLQRRTEQLATTRRTEDALDEFAVRELRRLGDFRPLSLFHHCPFLGLIGPEQDRVGCLLHPLVPENEGIDYRGLSYYGAAACRFYFCPTYYRLPARHKRILQVTAPDWYLYGLLVTEYRLLQALIREIDIRLGREVVADDLTAGTEAGQRMQTLLKLKESWPYRSHAGNGPCHYMFEDGPYERPPVHFPAGTAQDVRYAAIFRELESVFDTPQTLCSATSQLSDLLDSVANALPGEAASTLAGRPAASSEDTDCMEHTP